MTTMTRATTTTEAMSATKATASREPLMGAPGRTIAGLTMTLAMGLLPACGDDPVRVDPTMATVAGVYAAEGAIGELRVTQFTIEGEVFEITDWLDAGASVLLDLREDGSATGRLLAPGAGDEGADIDEDLAGSWSLTVDRVTLEHEADTFLRDVEFTVDGSTLVAEGDFGSFVVRVVVVRR